MGTSHNVLLAHEDKTFSGAFVASASIPWGQVKGDDDLGGYHLVWTRDMVQTAYRAAWPAGGRRPRAARWFTWPARRSPTADLRRTSGSTERPTGQGMQLDEVAFPIILAWRLWKANGAGESADFPVRGAGGGLSGAPCAHYPPGAVGRESRLFAFDAGGGDWRADLRGGDCACARFHRTGGLSGGIRRLDREASRRLDGHKRRQCCILRSSATTCAFGRRRRARLMPARAAARRSIRIQNRPPGTRTEFEAREIIDGGFLELVRYGVRRADDPLMVDSLKVVDCGSEARSAAGAGLAALQLGRLRAAPGRRALSGLGAGPRVAAADRASVRITNWPQAKTSAPSSKRTSALPPAD